MGGLLIHIVPKEFDQAIKATGCTTIFTHAQAQVSYDKMADVSSIKDSDQIGNNFCPVRYDPLLCMHSLDCQCPSYIRTDSDNSDQTVSRI